MTDGSEPKLLGDDEQFHATDEAVDLSQTAIEGWLALGLFWLLGATVAYQFVTRYLFNDSAAWTEEIARYLLIGMVFVGASVGVRENNHIQVDVLYRYLPARAGHFLSLAVDVVRIAFFASMVWLTALLMREMGDYEMTIVPLPMNILYAVCWLGFAAMTWRSIGVLGARWKRGHSVLTRREN
jgi:TRAP-type C4-dicarboxylate transport system permease small subunit